MSATFTPHIVPEIPGYGELQRTMHDALIAQHPEWIQRNGDCPTCHDYDRRFAQLLSSSLAGQRVQAN